MTDLERIIATAGKGKHIHAAHIAQSLFLNAFTDYMSESHVQKLVNSKKDLSQILIKDYLKRFGCSVNGVDLKMSDAFTGLLKKDPNNYNRKKVGFALADVDSAVASSFYEGLIKRDFSKDLLKKARNVNDLKAIYFIDKLHESLICDQGVFLEEYNPEQSFIRMIQVLEIEKPLKYLKQHSSTMQNIRDDMEKLTKLSPTKKTVSRLDELSDISKRMNDLYSPLNIKGYESLLGDMTQLCKTCKNTNQSYRTKHTAYSDNQIIEMTYDLEKDETFVKTNIGLLKDIQQKFILFGKDPSMFAGRLERQRRQGDHQRQVRARIKKMETDLNLITGRRLDTAKRIDNAQNEIEKQLESYRQDTDRYLKPYIEDQTSQLEKRLNEVSENRESLVDKSREVLNSFETTRSFKNDYGRLLSKEFSNALDNLRLLSPNSKEIAMFAKRFEDYSAVNDHLERLTKFGDNGKRIQRDIIRLKKSRQWLDQAISIKKNLNSYRTLFIDTKYTYDDLNSMTMKYKEGFDYLKQQFKDNIDSRMSSVSRSYNKTKSVVDSYKIRKTKMGRFLSAFNIYSNIRLSRAKDKLNKYMGELRCINKILPI